MKRVYIKKKINEDDNTQPAQNTTNTAQTATQTQPQANADNPQNQNPQNNQTGLDEKTIATQLVALQAQYDNALRTYNDAVAAAKKAFNTTKTEVTTRLGNINKASGKNYTLTMSESVDEFKPINLIGDLRFGKKLFEATKGDSAVEDLKTILYSAIIGVNASKTPSNPQELKSYAKQINAFINRSGWAKDRIPKSHWDELAAFIENKFKTGTLFDFSESGRDPELPRVMNLLKERFSKSARFSWIFGNEMK